MGNSTVRLPRESLPRGQAYINRSDLCAAVTKEGDSYRLIKIGANIEDLIADVSAMDTFRNIPE